MRSNIARTESAGSVPVRAAKLARLGAAAARRAVSSQRGEEVHERLFLVLREAGEGGHRRGGVLERAADRRLLQLAADVREVRAGAVVAVLADLVAGQAAGLRGHQ